MVKKLSFILIALMFVIMAGCGNTEDSNNEGKSGEESGDKVTLNLLQFKTEIVEQVKQMAEDYQKENPNVQINAQVVDDYSTLRKARFASGQGPDIFFVRGYTDMEDWSEYLTDLSNEPWMDQVSEAAKPGMTLDGKMYGFPVGLEGYGFIYNKDLFKEAGIEEVPKTLSELEEVNEKLKAAGIKSFTEGYKEDWILGLHLFNLPFSAVEDPGAYAQGLKSGEKTLNDNPYMDGFFNVLDATVDYGEGTNSIGVDYTRQLSSFTSGESAMMQQGVWTMGSIEEANADMNIGMFAIPLSENAEETRLPVDVPAYYAVNNQSDHVEEAKKFLTWLHENGDTYLVDSFNFIPAFEDIETTDELGPLAKELMKYSKEGQTMPWAMNYWPSGLDTDFAAALQSYVAGQTNQEETIEQLQSIVDDRMKE
ncbi:ABC transporter substrate-binding protein [Salinibacillus xinjiangensis]|uniref:Extracellular solute-binding protein n=1 Tax=Salinibacillus xinjiangensis TaxID=1229268 RepID=A0A6G1XA18_9BACI|nr:extracellular solute-binding protein [Salinibacillus xinjiangensis]MRG87861.1 extracellular solute-binding protein [Salinibacillus xinjiangensis]